MTNIQLSVATDFSETPGPRSREQGDFSGDLFLDEVLRPKFQEAVRQSSNLYIDLDGTEGYATSFLEAAFGGLAREFGPGAVLQRLEFKSEDEPYLVDEVKKYISEANKK